MAGVSRRLIGDLRGVAALAVDGVVGTTAMVERLHAAIAAVSPPLGGTRREAARGIPGFVYRRVRGVARLVGHGIDGALAPFAGEGIVDSPHRDHVLAALNGVLGDRLAANGNPLAIPMRLRRDDGSANGDAPRIALFVHGLCMHDGHWPRGEGSADAAVRALGYAPHYLHYNSGPAIADNGRELSRQIGRLLRGRKAELAIVGHSMGGLLARSACEHARRTRAPWLSSLRTLLFLGTPHHGSALERAGQRVDHLLGLSGYSAPFAALGGLRSQGIRDLADGRVGAGEHFVPPPPRVRLHALAGRLRLDSDGLVAVDSALGRPGLGLRPRDTRVLEGVGHLELMRHPDAVAAIAHWLRPRARPVR